jgi:hypothetical protein
MGRLFLGVIVSLSLFGCGMADNNYEPNHNPNLPQKPTAENLSNKSVQEVLQIKYTKAVLTCSLWLQWGKKLDVSNSPNDKVTWDLLKDFSTTKNLQLNGWATNTSTSVNLTIKSVELANGEIGTPEGAVYKYQYSPRINLDYAFETIVSTTKGPYSDEVYGNKDIGEKVGGMLSNTSIKAEGSENSVFYYADCTIDTEIKPEYADQFKVVERP